MFIVAMSFSFLNLKVCSSFRALFRNHCLSQGLLKILRLQVLAPSLVSFHIAVTVAWHTPVVGKHPGPTHTSHPTTFEGRSLSSCNMMQHQLPQPMKTLPQVKSMLFNKTDLMPAPDISCPSEGLKATCTSDQWNTNLAVLKIPSDLLVLHNTHRTEESALLKFTIVWRTHVPGWMQCRDTQNMGLKHRLSVDAEQVLPRDLVF